MYIYGHHSTAHGKSCPAKNASPFRFVWKNHFSRQKVFEFRVLYFGKNDKFIKRQGGSKEPCKHGIKDWNEEEHFSRQKVFLRMGL
jgi:hypothetical protein